MSKAILVLDRTPDACHECPLFNSGYTDMHCKAMNNKIIHYPYPKDFRQDWCPLKAVPEYELIWNDDGNDFEKGFNTCLDEILGEKQ